MGACGDCARHFVALSGAGPGSAPRVLSLQGPGLPRRHGSEYINRKVVELLGKLHVREFTKSRSRHSNDNGLVESKNGT